MFLPKKVIAVQLTGMVLAGLVHTNSFAQQDYDDPNVGLKYNQKTISNQFPCGECAVFDNNGNDLRGFINSNKNDISAKGSLVNEYSNNTWGYVEIKDAKTPSLDKQGNLSYYQAFDATLALYKTDDGAKATWWAREANAPRGPLVNIKVDADGKLGLDLTKHNALFHEMETKKMTLIEYYSEGYDQLDYDVFFKNYILMKADIVKNVDDYKKIIDFYNGFLGKFTNTSDPQLENKSFVTCFTINNVKYIGYFNFVNSKLAGKLDVAGIVYDKDRETVTNNIFRKLTGKVVYVYGNDVFGMDKAIIKYGRAHNIKLIRRKTTDDGSFNEIID